MKKETILKNFKTTAFALSACALLVSCGGSGRGGSGSGGGSSTAGYYTSPYVSAQQFVNSLNSTDGYYDNEVVKMDTIRGEGFFVYYDGEWGELVAVDVDYLRTIQYWSYYSSNSELASEYRDRQDDDFFDWGMIGDGAGFDYEIVEDGFYDADTGEDVYWGVDSGNFYEDEEQTVDTGVMAANAQEKELFEQAAKYSVVFKIPAKKALSLVSMEKEVKRMLADAKNGELLEADREAFAKNIEHFTGKSIADFEAAKADPTLALNLKEEIAANLGVDGDTTAIETLFDLDSQL